MTFGHLKVSFLKKFYRDIWKIFSVGSGRPIPPPEVEEFIPNMHFPTSEEIEYLDTFVQYKDTTFEELNSRFLFRKLNDRLVKLDENGFELINLDKVDGSFEQHLAKLFDIFIRHMIEKAGGSLEKTRFWFEWVKLNRCIIILFCYLGCLTNPK